MLQTISSSCQKISITGHTNLESVINQIQWFLNELFLGKDNYFIPLLNKYHDLTGPVSPDLSVHCLASEHFLCRRPVPLGGGNHIPAKWLKLQDAADPDLKKEDEML